MANKFKEVFEALYKSAGSQNGMETVQARIRELLGKEDSRSEVEKVTANVVKQAASMTKPHKMDVSQGFSSDALLHAPDVLFELLALILGTG